GDGPDYSIDREVEDVLAVIDASGPPVHLVGHSFGAILCVLVAAQASERIDKLVLYEPPVSEQPPTDNSLEDQLDTLVAAGELDAAVATFSGPASVTDKGLQTNRSR